MRYQAATHTHSQAACRLTIIQHISVAAALRQPDVSTNSMHLAGRQKDTHADCDFVALASCLAAEAAPVPANSDTFEAGVAAVQRTSLTSA